MPHDEAKQNIYLTSAIISTGLLFMLITGFYIVENTGNSNSREMAIDQRIDQCYEEKGLD
jgi:hypothetical protein